MSGKKLKRGQRTERILSVLKSGGSAADLVKRLGMKPTTANFYVWRYGKDKDFGSVKRGKNSIGLRGYERGKKGLGKKFPVQQPKPKAKKELKRVTVERERQKALSPTPVTLGASK